jgi:hypothetical protein
MAGMKKLLFSLYILAFSLSVWADVTTNLISLTYINGTNGGGVYYASNVIVPTQKYIIQSLGITNGGATATNFITVNIQYSVDPANSNWQTLVTYHPATTNATVELLSTNIGLIALPMRAQVITTNSLGVSIFKQP